MKIKSNKKVAVYFEKTDHESNAN